MLFVGAVGDGEPGAPIEVHRSCHLRDGDVGSQERGATDHVTTVVRVRIGPICAYRSAARTRMPSSIGTVAVRASSSVRSRRQPASATALSRTGREVFIVPTRLRMPSPRREWSLNHRWSRYPGNTVTLPSGCLSWNT